MLPFAIVIGQNIFGAFYSLLSRKLSVKFPHAQLQVSAVLFTLTLVVALPFAFWYGHVYLADLEKWWPYLLLGGLGTALNGATVLLVFRYMDAAMGSLLLTTNVVVAILSAMYMLGERMSLQRVVGAAIVLAAVVYALSVHVSRRERRNWAMGILCTAAAAILFAITSVTEKFLLGEMGVSSYLTWGWGTQWVMSLLLAVLIGGSQFKIVLARRNLSLLSAAAVMRSGMGMLFVFSLVVIKSLCTALVLAGMRPLFVAFLGAWLLKERKFFLRKVVASGIAALGVAIMFWRA